MKRFKAAMLLLMMISIALSTLTVTSAENSAATPWRADLTALMDPADIPATTTIKYDVSTPDGSVVEEKRHSVELVSSKGDVLNVEVTFELVNLPLSGDQWAEVTEWLKNLVTSSVQSVGADSESLANVVANAIATQRKSAQANGQAAAIWANGNLMVKQVTASVPYYPELSNGVNGAATQRLQQRLIELGFLDDRADGYYGANTQAAVQKLEEYVRLLEQDAIDTRPEPTATPTPTPVPTATPTPAPDIIPLTLGMPALTPEPTVEPTPTPDPEPATVVDGVADAMLQAYLFSDEFRVTRGALSAGDSGDAVRRVQNRLVNLGYMAEAPDGAYGASTSRSLMIFQYYNGLPRTGGADVATQEALFSGAARRPDNAMLVQGSSGDAVSKLQKRLRILGFAAISVDGSYGSSTKTGVENLQKYLLEMESEAVAASTGSQPDGAQLSMTVNGVADPLLLDEFYAASFPAIPAPMSNGSTGRDVVRLQRRLSLLEYYYGSLDGQYGPGTAKAVADFQKRHGLSQTGSADTQTLQTLFNENALKALKPYVLKVSVSDQRVYAYGLDSNNEYTVLVRTMKCSTGKSGTPTPTGTFENSTGPGARWHYFTKFDCWAQYAYYIQGDIMFHSVLYGSKEGRVTQSSVNNLGRRASHGCVRLSVEDAKWIWTNCPRNTKVVIG